MSRAKQIGRRAFYSFMIWYQRDTTHILSLSGVWNCMKWLLLNQASSDVISFCHRYKGRSQTSYTASCNGVVSHGAQIGGLQGFSPHMLKQMRPWSLRTVLYFTGVNRHARTAVDTDDIRTWQTMVILITGNTRRPPIWAPCRDKNDAGLGSPLYICCFCNNIDQDSDIKLPRQLISWNVSKTGIAFEMPKVWPLAWIDDNKNTGSVFGSVPIPSS